MLDDIDTKLENAAERIRCEGFGAELVRKFEVDHLRDDIEAFYAHASLADIVALRRTLELRANLEHSVCRATLVEAFLNAFDLVESGESPPPRQ